MRFHNALTIHTQINFPFDWAATQNNLGTVYRKRIRGNRAENFEQAIQCYQNALTTRSTQDFPLEWASTQNNLGNAYSERIKGDRAENLEKAIASYENALIIYTQAKFPLDWAATQNNLATAYSNRIRGDRDENLERAIAYYQNALQEWRQDTYPYEWAMIQNVPSCQILKILKLGQKSPLKNTNINLGIVGNPTDNLFGSEIECDAIAKMYYVPNCNYLRNKQDATVNNFRELLKRVQIIHFSGHGISRLDNPLESQLFLGDGSITLGEILTCRLPNLRQVFLSSCESGFSNITITDDALNIGTSFLLAPASNVCSTLWAVDDLATAIFSIFYYQYLKDSFDCCTALQQAQQRLKHLSNEEFERNYCIDFHEYLTIQFEQARTNRKQVTAQLKQLPQSTPKFSRLELEAEKSYWNQAERKIYARGTEL